MMTQLSHTSHVYLDKSNLCESLIFLASLRFAAMVPIDDTCNVLCTLRLCAQWGDGTRTDKSGGSGSCGTSCRESLICSRAHQSFEMERFLGWEGEHKDSDRVVWSRLRVRGMLGQIYLGIWGQQSHLRRPEAQHQCQGATPQNMFGNAKETRHRVRVSRSWLVIYPLYTC